MNLCTGTGKCKVLAITYNMNSYFLECPSCVSLSIFNCLEGLLSVSADVCLFRRVQEIMEFIFKSNICPELHIWSLKGPVCFQFCKNAKEHPYVPNYFSES